MHNDPHAEHKDEHTHVTNETQHAAPDPAHQSDGAGLGELDAEIRGHVSDHGSESEYKSLSGMKPRSLGERAKMEVLKKQYHGK